MKARDGGTALIEERVSITHADRPQWEGVIWAAPYLLKQIKHHIGSSANIVLYIFKIQELKKLIHSTIITPKIS